MFELTSATQSGAIAARLCLFDHVLLRGCATNAICGHRRCRGCCAEESEARGRDGSNYERSHVCTSFGFFRRPFLMPHSDRGSHMVNFAGRSTKDIPTWPAALTF